MVRTTTFAGLAVLIAGVAACGGEPVAVPGAGDLAPAAVVVPTGDRFTVIVCKEGPTSPSTFTVTANTGDVVLVSGSTFTLGADNPCRPVAVTTSRLQSVTVTETSPAAGSVFRSADVYKYLASTGSRVLNRVSSSPTVTVNPFGADVGWVIVFHNRDG